MPVYAGPEVMNSSRFTAMMVYAGPEYFARKHQEQENPEEKPEQENPEPEDRPRMERVYGGPVPPEKPVKL